MTARTGRRRAPPGDPDLVPHGGVVAGNRRLVVDDAVLEGLHHGPDAGQRGAQIVGHPRHQVAPALLSGRRFGPSLSEAGRGRGRWAASEPNSPGAEVGASSAPFPRRRARSPMERLASATRRPPAPRAATTATVPALTSTTHRTRRSCSIRNISELAQLTPIATANTGVNAATAVCTAMRRRCRARRRITAMSTEMPAPASESTTRRAVSWAGTPAAMATAQAAATPITADRGGQPAPSHGSNR